MASTAVRFDFCTEIVDRLTFVCHVFGNLGFCVGVIILRVHREICKPHFTCMLSIFRNVTVYFSSTMVKPDKDKFSNAVYLISSANKLF